ncbi:HAD family hydrolase [Thalassospiraceae bacterium LMO-JJ14]|nr:HAD family hydrolase [Thalassospiraceae bacterium LMO-JJ14]
MTLSAIIFDVDGTLAETEELHRQAFNAAFTEAGMDWHWGRELYGELLKTTGGKERIHAYHHNYKSNRAIITREQIAELHRAKTLRYGELLDGGGLELRPGIATLIEQARQEGIRLAIATTTSRANVDALCRTCWKSEPERIFEVIAAGDEVPNKKPAPDVYLLALERLGLAANKCVAIEDSRNGVFSAIEAGLRVHVIPSTYTAAEEFGDRARIWQSMPTLEEILQIF